jgi:hypothetical protein
MKAPAPFWSADALVWVSSQEEFSAWLAIAAPGDRIEYARGYLPALDSASRVLSEADQRSGRGCRAFIQCAAEQGRVTFVQIRRGAFDYSYIAQRLSPHREDVLRRRFEARNRRLPHMGNAAALARKKRMAAA